MNTISTVQVIGEIESVERKTVKGKPVTEFRIRDLGLRISAWEARAAQVPDTGIVIVNGYLSTRSYTYEGSQRETTEIRATAVQAIAPAIDATEPF